MDNATYRPTGRRCQILSVSTDATDRVAIVTWQDADGARAVLPLSSLILDKS